MRRHHASLVSTLTGLSLLLQHATASISSRAPQEVEIVVTSQSTCEQKTKNGDTINVHYNGTLTDGKPFDSSYSRDAPLAFTLGRGQVIAGWDEGLLDMCPGEIRRLTIPSNKAYGMQGAGIIPPGATLVFDTLLVSVEIGPEHGEDEDEEEDGDEDDGDEEESDFAIQTAPAEPPAPQATTPPEVQADEEQEAEAEADAAQEVQEDKPPSLDELMSQGPIPMPTRLPDPPITGLQVASTAPLAVATQQPIHNPPADPGNHPGSADGECRLLGPFALIVQAALGLLALSSLVFKRWRERPRRPFRVWAFDASKQVVGTALIHVLNLMMSILSAADFEIAHKAEEISASFENAANKEVNPCSWYLINIAIDTTIGIPILVVLLRLLHQAFLRTPLARPPESIRSGHYGQPPRAKWWVKQSFIYFIGLILMKLCVFFIIQILPWIALVGDWALRWTEGNQTLQIAFVMFVFPLVMNALQYYIIDSFIKDASGGHERVPTDDDDSDATQTSYHSVDHRDSLDSNESDGAKETSRLNPASDAGNRHDRASPSGSARIKDA